MKTLKKLLAILLAVILATGSFSINIGGEEWIDEVDFMNLHWFEDIILEGTADFKNRDNLQQGQVWTGKSVKHHNNADEFGDDFIYVEDMGVYMPIRAAATITLYALGRSFWQEPPNETGDESNFEPASFSNIFSQMAIMETPAGEASVPDNVTETKDDEAETQNEDTNTDEEDIETKDEEAETKEDEAEEQNKDANTEEEDIETKDEETETKDEEADTKDEDAEIKDEDAEEQHEDASTEDEYIETKDEETETKDEETETKDEEAEEPTKDGELAVIIEEDICLIADFNEVTDTDSFTDNFSNFGGGFDTFNSFMPYASETDDDAYARGDNEYLPLAANNPYLVISDTLGAFRLEGIDDLLNIEMSKFALSYKDAPIIVTHQASLGTDGETVIGLDKDTATTSAAGDWDISIGIDEADNNRILEVVWRIHQDDFVGLWSVDEHQVDPVSLQFVIYLGDDAEPGIHTYASGTVQSVRYYPNLDSRRYYKWFQEELNMFEVPVGQTLSWNNGGGNNKGAFRDVEFNVTFSWTKIDSTAGLTYLQAPASEWTQINAFYAETETSGIVYIHCEWNSGGGPRIFTIRDFPEVGMYTQYQVVLPPGNPGGNDGVPGYRIIISDIHERIEYYPENPDTPINWAGNAIVSNINARARIQLYEQAAYTGNIVVSKEIASLVYNLDNSEDRSFFYTDWGVDEDTVFETIIFNNTLNQYLMLVPTGEFTYAFDATSSFRSDASVVQFTVRNPVTITGVPTSYTNNPGVDGHLYTITEINATRSTDPAIRAIEQDRINILYTIEGGQTPADVLAENQFRLLNDGTANVTVINEYGHGIGNLAIFKQLDGAFEDRNIKINSTFYARVWDVDAENYLLFKSDPLGSDGLVPGSFWCVGNQQLGFTESVGTDVGIMMEIPITADTISLLSNLWTWGSYEVREVRLSPAGEALVQERGENALWDKWDTWRATAPTEPWFSDGSWEEKQEIQDFFGPVDGTDGWFGLWEEVKPIENMTEFLMNSDWDWGVSTSYLKRAETLQFMETWQIFLTNTFKYESGQMFITKSLTGYYEDWAVNDTTTFFANVFNKNKDGNLDKLLFEKLQFGFDESWLYVGYEPYGGGSVVFYDEKNQDRYNTNPNIFVSDIPFSGTEEGRARIVGLPVSDEYNFVVKEVLLDDDPLREFVDNEIFVNQMPQSDNGVPAESTQSIFVNIINHYEYGNGSVILRKDLSGFGFTWGINDNTTFYVAVIQVGSMTENDSEPTEGKQLAFSLNDGVYELASEGDNLIEFIPINVATPTIIQNLSRMYEYTFKEFVLITTEDGNEFIPIEEHFPAGMVTVNMDYDLDSFMNDDIENRNMPVIITNTFAPATGSMTVNKVLENPHEGAENETFEISVSDDGFHTKLYFVPYHLHWHGIENNAVESDNKWWCVGNNIDGASEDWTGIEKFLTMEIPISVDSPAILLNLWAGTQYSVMEVTTGNFTAHIAQDTRTMWNDDMHVVTVTNTYFPRYNIIYQAIDKTGGDVPADLNLYMVGQQVPVKDKGTLERADYDFVGWSLQEETEPNSDDIIAPNQQIPMVEGGLKLYAVWQPVDYYYVTFNCEKSEGDLPVDPTGYRSNRAVSLLCITDTEGTPIFIADEALECGGKREFTFVGWSENNDAQPGDDCVLIPGEHSITMQTNNVHLYAVWSHTNNYRVFYDGNGNREGTMPPIDSAFYSEGAPVSVLNITDTEDNEPISKEPVVIGDTLHEFIFIGWSLNNNAHPGDEDIFLPNSEFPMPNNSVTLYAVWQSPNILESNAIFMWNRDEDDTEVYEQATYQHGAYVTRPLEDPNHQPLIFLGWFANKEATVLVNFDNVTMPADTDLVFYAGWITPQAEETDSIITIIVVDQNYEPVADVEVIVYDDDGKEVFRSQTDKDGRVRTRPLPDGKYTVVTEEDESYEPSAPVPVTIDGEDEAVTVRLLKKPNGGSVTVTVQDSNGDPIEDAEVIVYDEYDREVYRNRTDEDGRVKTPWLPDGNYSIKVIHPDYDLADSVPVQINNGDKSVIVTLLQFIESPPEEPKEPEEPEEPEEPSLLPLVPREPREEILPITPMRIKLPRFSDIFVSEHIWYVRGDNDNNIRPDDTASRADVAVVFYRLLRPELKFDPQPNPYTDVTSDEWYGRAVGILSHYGIIEGYEDGSFKPYQPITRREFAAIVSRFDNLTETDVNPYSDLDPDDWAYEYILSATARGWFVGHNGMFRPDANLTRAEMVTAINRILRRRISLKDIPAGAFRFPDLYESHWAFTDITEAAHTHTFVRNEDGYTELWIEIIGTGIDAPYNE